MTTFLLAVAVAFDARAEAAPVHWTETNVMIELPFTSTEAHKDPFNDVTLDVVFTDPNGKDFRVPAFWAGGTTWKVR